MCYLGRMTKCPCTLKGPQLTFSAYLASNTVIIPEERKISLYSIHIISFIIIIIFMWYSLLTEELTNKNKKKTTRNSLVELKKMVLNLVYNKKTLSKLHCSRINLSGPLNIIVPFSISHFHPI